MPLDPLKALTTPDRVRRELGVPSFDADTAAWVEDSIADLSDEATKILNRGPLHYEAGIEERVSSGGGQRLFLRRTPLLVLTSVVELPDDGDEDDADDIDITDAMILNEGKTGIVFLRSGWPDTGELGTGLDDANRIDSGAPTLLVTYTAGWVLPGQAADAVGDTPALVRTLPRDLEKAVVMTVVDGLGQRGVSRSIASTSALSGSVTFVNQATRQAAGGAGSFGPEAMQILNRYKRVAMGRRS